MYRSDLRSQLFHLRHEVGLVLYLLHGGELQDHLQVRRNQVERSKHVAVFVDHTLDDLHLDLLAGKAFGRRRQVAQLLVRGVPLPVLLQRRNVCVQLDCCGVILFALTLVGFAILYVLGIVFRGGDVCGDALQLLAQLRGVLDLHVLSAGRARALAELLCVLKLVLQSGLQGG
ncbi:hypothetical protein D3C86_1447170 [compost metagenome]